MIQQNRKKNSTTMGMYLLVNIYFLQLKIISIATHAIYRVTLVWHTKFVATKNVTIKGKVICIKV